MTGIFSRIISLVLSNIAVAHALASLVPRLLGSYFGVIAIESSYLLAYCSGLQACGGPIYHSLAKKQPEIGSRLARRCLYLICNLYGLGNVPKVFRSLYQAAGTSWRAA